MLTEKRFNRICLVCGSIELKLVKRGNPKFLCSPTCKKKRKADKWRKDHPLNTSPINCGWCTNEFVPHPLVRYKARYCSIQCRRKGYSERIKEFYKRHPRKKAEYNRDARQQKKWNGNWYKALQRDNFTCQFCGISGEQNTLHRRIILVHHLDGEGEKQGKNHSLDNLITSCYDCHEGLHGISLLKIDGQWWIKSKIFKHFDFTSLPIYNEN